MTVSYWLPVITGFLGVAVGALLEMTRRSHERRLRIQDEKVRLYAEFGGLCSRVAHLRRRIVRMRAEHDAFRDLLDQMQRRELAESPEEQEALEAFDVHTTSKWSRILQSQDQRDEYMNEIWRVYALIRILAPWKVRHPASQLVTTLADDHPEADTYAIAIAEFNEAAGNDLGVEPNERLPLRREVLFQVWYLHRRVINTPYTIRRWWSRAGEWARTGF